MDIKQKEVHLLIPERSRGPGTWSRQIFLEAPGIPLFGGSGSVEGGDNTVQFLFKYRYQICYLILGSNLIFHFRYPYLFLIK